MHAHRKVLVQISDSANTFLINTDTLLIEQDRIPNRGRCGVLDPGSAKVELPLANAMHQIDARNRGRSTPEPFEAEHHVWALSH
jgi:hypothetical protein